MIAQTEIAASLYNHNSLRNEGDGVSFSLVNRRSPMQLKQIEAVCMDSAAINLENLFVTLDNAQTIRATDVDEKAGLELPLGAQLTFTTKTAPLEDGDHEIIIQLKTDPTGSIRITASDRIGFVEKGSNEVPRGTEDDYSEHNIKLRQDFIRDKTGTKLDHVSRFSFDPHLTIGNIENLTGVSQIPLGFAGPLLVDGQHAKGEFHIPLATTEGTLVASYNRGMKLLRRSDGVRCAVVGDQMQRAPAFAFSNASDAYRFSQWVSDRLNDLKEVTAATDSYLLLKNVDCFLASRFAYMRFNYETGDAAGQNMVGKATFSACNWILQNCKFIEIQHLYLESNIATDKKPSMMNLMRTRGKRVTAEATIKNSDLIEVLNTDAESLHRFSGVANLGAMLSGSNNNGCHSVNAITAIFIATGQDVANVSEASAAMLYTELTPTKDLYISITLPSLIVATCGGGTELPTQRECLQALGCFGAGKVNKFAEIVAGTVLAGELSLAGAISALDWVSSHERMGRNAPKEI